MQTEMATTAILQERVSEGMNMLLVKHIPRILKMCTLQENALTWWNSHVKTTTLEVAHVMPWKMLKKMMTDKYCPRGEIKKIEFEMWNLKVKGTDVKYVDGLARHDPSQCEWKLSEDYARLPLSSHRTKRIRKSALLLKDKRRTRGNMINTTKLQQQLSKRQNLGTEARGMVYALEGGDTDQDLNNIEDEIKA
ncbi:putative reverse transcriptase domain-containing protein [Tanacetum coccineum]